MFDPSNLCIVVFAFEEAVEYGAKVGLRQAPEALVPKVYGVLNVLLIRWCSR
jgi:hypothetical protein